jgi:hypothetical protein
MEVLLDAGCDAKAATAPSFSQHESVFMTDFWWQDNNANVANPNNMRFVFIIMLFYKLIKAASSFAQRKPRLLIV